MDFDFSNENSKPPLPYQANKSELAHNTTFINNEGEHFSINNSYFQYAVYRPEESLIEIEYGIAKVSIEGRMLDELFTQILSGKVTSVNVSSKLDDMEGMMFIERISVSFP